METHSTIAHLIPEALVAAAAAKPVEVQLAWYVEAYKVLAIMNTTILQPGEWLSVAAVDQLCSTPNWTVKMSDNTVIQTLFGLGASATEIGAKV
jgi:hypothetical protein